MTIITIVMIYVRTMTTTTIIIILFLTIIVLSFPVFSFFYFPFSALLGTLPTTWDDLWLQTIITFYHKAVSNLDKCGSCGVTGCALLFVQLILMMRNIWEEKMEAATRESNQNNTMAIATFHTARLCLSQHDLLLLSVNKWLDFSALLQCPGSSHNRLNTGLFLFYFNQPAN